MKFSTFSALFETIIATAVGTSPSHSDPANTLVAVSIESSAQLPPNVPIMATTVPLVVEFAPLDFDLDPDLDLGVDLGAGHGRLSQSLSEADVDAVFLEATLRDVLNNISKETGIDLVADSVTVVKNAVVVEAVADTDTTTIGGDNSNSNRQNNDTKNLRGRPHRKPPVKDREMCTYHMGPHKGNIIPGCIFDIVVVSPGDGPVDLVHVL